MKPLFSFSRRQGSHTAGELAHLWQINKYLWMSLSFASLYLAFVQLQGRLSVPGWVAWCFYLLALADGAGRTMMAYRHGGSLRDTWAWFFTICDVSLISIGVAITGGVTSEFWLLYFVVMIFESLFATREQKRLMNVSVFCAYLLATLPHQWLVHPPQVSMLAWAIMLLSRMFALILVSSLARRIGEIAAERQRENALLQEQVATAGERARIARELHDGLGHALVSSILRLELCSRIITRDVQEAQSILYSEVPALRAAWNESRDLAFHLRPWELDVVREGGFQKTLEVHIRQFGERTGLAVTLEMEGTWQGEKADSETIHLSPETAFGLTRIVQEALTNAARHANATSVKVRLCHVPEGVRCEIIDNGIGFTLERVGGGVGLASMRERAEALGGRLDVSSEMGQGTQIRAIVPA